MDSLKNVELSRPILPAVIGIVSCVISISSLMGIKKLGFSVVIFVISSACAFCFKKLLDHYRHYKSIPGAENYPVKSRPKKYQELSSFLNFSEELSNFTEQFHRRRHSYPLQISEEIDFTFLKLIETFDKNYTARKENIELDNDSVRHKERTPKHPVELHVNLRKCINTIENSIEDLKKLTLKDVLDLEQHQSPGDAKILVRPKDNEINPSDQNEISPRVTEKLVNYSQITKDINEKPSPSLGRNEKPTKLVGNDSTNRFRELNNPVASMDQGNSVVNQDATRVSQIVNHGIRQAASFQNLLHGDPLKQHQKKLQSSQTEKCSHSVQGSFQSSMSGIALPGLEKELKQQPDLQQSPEDSQKATACLQQIAKCISSGVILDPSKLKKAEIGPLPNIKRTVSVAQFNSDAMSPNVSDPITFEKYLKTFVSREDMKKRLESTHLSHSSDTALPSGFIDYRSLNPSTVGLDMTELLDERDTLPLCKYSSESIESMSSSTPQMCVKGGIASDLSKERYVQHPNSDSFPSGEDNTAYGSSESIVVSEPSCFVLYPLLLEGESSSTVVRERRDVEDGTSSVHSRRRSEEITSSTSQLVEMREDQASTASAHSGTQTVGTRNISKQNSKSSLICRVRNSLKFGSKKKKSAKDQDSKY